MWQKNTESTLRGDKQAQSWIPAKQLVYLQTTYKHQSDAPDRVTVEPKCHLPTSKKKKYCREY